MQCKDNSKTAPFAKCPKRAAPGQSARIILVFVLTLEGGPKRRHMRTLLIFLLPSLGTVSTAQTAAQGRAHHLTLSTRQLHEWAISRTVLIVARPNAPVQSLGSGVWVSKDGYVATCWHVVENADEIQVKIAYPGVYDL